MKKNNHKNQKKKKEGRHIYTQNRSRPDQPLTVPSTETAMLYSRYIVLLLVILAPNLWRYI